MAQSFGSLLLPQAGTHIDYVQKTAGLEKKVVMGTGELNEIYGYVEYKGFQ
jgi:hypothetical protein